MRVQAGTGNTALVACWEHAEYVTSLAEPVMRLLDRADRDQRKVVIARGSRMIASSNKGPCKERRVFNIPDVPRLVVASLRGGVDG